MNASDIKQLLVTRIEDVLLHLLPAGKRNANYWHVGSVDGEPGDSLKVCMSGPKTGVWIEGNASGQNGDILSLWCAVKGVSLRDELPNLRKWLGVADMPRIHSPGGNKEYHRPNLSTAVELNKKSVEVVRSYLSKERRIPIEILESNGVQGIPDFSTRDLKFGPSICFNYFSPNGDLELVKIVAIARNDRGKKIMTCIPRGKPILFGMHSHLVLNSDGVLVICEGEIDALSWQACGIPAVSVPFGAKGENGVGESPNDEWIRNSFDFLDGFHTIYICADQDEDGRIMQECLVKRLGQERCLIVRLPKKDANECLLAGMDLKRFLATATQPGVSDVKNGHELEELAMNNDIAIDENSGHPFMGWNLPIGKRFNVRHTEGTVVTGFGSHGKSNALYQYVAHKACTHGTKFFVGSYEEPAQRILRLMACHALGHKVESASFIERQALHEQLFGRVYIHAKQSSSVPVKEYFENARYSARRYGCEEAILDSASCMDFDMDEKAEMTAFVKECQTFWKEIGCHLWVIMHPRKGLNEQVPPEKQDIKGSGVAGDLFFNVVTFHRIEPTPANPAPECDGQMIMSKQKVGGQKPRPFLKYESSCYRVNPVGHPNPCETYLKLPQSTEKPKVDYPE